MNDQADGRVNPRHGGRQCHLAGKFGGVASGRRRHEFRNTRRRDAGGEPRTPLRRRHHLRVARSLLLPPRLLPRRAIRRVIACRRRRRIRTRSPIANAIRRVIAYDPISALIAITSLIAARALARISMRLAIADAITSLITLISVVIDQQRDQAPAGVIGDLPIGHHAFEHRADSAGGCESGFDGQRTHPDSDGRRVRLARQANQRVIDPRDGGNFDNDIRIHACSFNRQGGARRPVHQRD